MAAATTLVPSSLCAVAALGGGSSFMGRKLLNSKAAGKCRDRVASQGGRSARAEWGAGDYNGLVLGVGVGLPCTVMECGDMIYRSTLPQSDGINITPPGVLLAMLAASYLWATPGVAPGFFDMFVLALLQRFFRPSYTKEDFVLDKKLGEGAFGVVYKSFLTKKTQGKADALVVKKATEYGAVEIWMNERVRRACASSCADFVHGFIEVERMILGEVDKLPKGIERENRIIQTIMRQILFALDGLHSTGIVHRDIKPQNIIFSQESRAFKIIDLGAAADLRVGINYVPKEFLLDPRYAAPEQYIMSTQTPSAPPAPVAAALSPVLWQMNLPDRFDIYSTGLIFLQMAFPSLRNDSSLIQFNRQLKRCRYDMVAWRESVEPRASPELRRGFYLLDLDGGIGWEFMLSMMRYKGRQRISAKGALAHPYFNRQGLLALSFMQALRLQLIRATQQDYNEAFQWVINLMAKSGTKTGGGFTEAQLQELRVCITSRFFLSLQSEL